MEVEGPSDYLSGRIRANVSYRFASEQGCDTLGIVLRA